MHKKDQKNIKKKEKKEEEKKLARVLWKKLQENYTALLEATELFHKNLVVNFIGFYWLNDSVVCNASTYHLNSCVPQYHMI